MTSLDIEQPLALIAYLRHTGRIAADESPAITVLAGGVSNRTVLVERSTGEAWVIKQALAKLRVKVDWFSDPARIEREAAGLRHLAALAPPGSITPLVFEDPVHHLLAMQAVPQPHENWKTMLLAGHIDPDHVTQFATLLGNIHVRSSEARDESESFASELDDQTFFETLRVEPYYQYTASRVPESKSFYDDVIASSRSLRLTLVHGDYSPKNVLVHNGKLVLLDHEVIHWGDPAFDLGFATCHLLSKAHHLPRHRPRFKHAALTFAKAYLDVLDASLLVIDLERRWIGHTLGCLLARVAGRSPLEYLNEDEKSAQRQAVITLMANPPATIPELTERFLAAV